MINEVEFFKLLPSKKDKKMLLEQFAKPTMQLFYLTLWGTNEPKSCCKKHNKQYSKIRITVLEEDKKKLLGEEAEKLGDVDWEPPAKYQKRKCWTFIRFWDIKKKKLIIWKKTVTLVYALKDLVVNEYKKGCDDDNLMMIPKTFSFISY